MSEPDGFMCTGCGLKVLIFGDPPPGAVPPRRRCLACDHVDRIVDPAQREALRQVLQRG